MRNTRVHVLDARGREAPVGVPGELCIGGVGVALGYLAEPALTAERFVPDPFASEPGSCMYRTGDLGRWREDGTLEFLGRRDSQVKIRGFRIEPGEVEAVLPSHPAVRQAVVTAREDEAGQKMLVAYVTPAHPGAAQQLSAQVLRAHLLEQVPDYMVPAAFVPLAALPLTVNGKVDVRLLPPPAEADRSTGEVPRGPTEQALASIWCELLGVQQVYRHDDFFDIGGHSLLAVRLASHIEARLGVRLSLARFFAEATLAELAAQVDSGAPVAAPPISADRRSRYLG